MDGTARFWTIPCDADGTPGAGSDEHPVSEMAANATTANPGINVGENRKGTSGRHPGETRQTPIESQIRAGPDSPSLEGQSSRSGCSRTMRWKRGWKLNHPARCDPT